MGVVRIQWDARLQILRAVPGRRCSVNISIVVFSVTNQGQAHGEGHAVGEAFSILRGQFHIKGKHLYLIFSQCWEARRKQDYSWM